MKLTRVDIRVVAVLFVCGNVSKQAFNTACNADDINKQARQLSFNKLKDNGVVDNIYPHNYD